MSSADRHHEPLHQAQRPEPFELPPPPRWLRWLLVGVGTLLVAVGLVGLALPIVPQMIPLVLGATALTLASDRLYRFLHRRLERWPRATAAVNRARHSVHLRLVLWFPRHYDGEDECRQTPQAPAADPRPGAPVDEDGRRRDASATGR
ncbi:MAG: hypothetical protein DWQ36_05185 [Acidobacteria bacterium]|nr:MAG: hypothetical protein DWQ30_10335 [Acidobacteriota bacterium]REK10172.1 MAG: hypothetical protein DWQ36_05185 [Acidobacteriota bacterium]